MYYEPGVTPHGLPHDPFKSCVIPRPIGWISTVDRDGRHNLAPFSQFQNITFDPPIVMFSANQDTRGLRKDSVMAAMSGTLCESDVKALGAHYARQRARAFVFVMVPTK